MATLTSTLPKPTSAGERPADLRDSNINYSTQRKSHVGLSAWLQRAVLHGEGAIAEMAPSPSSRRFGTTWVMLGWASKWLIASYSCPSKSRQASAPPRAAAALSLNQHSPRWVSCPPWTSKLRLLRR